MVHMSIGPVIARLREAKKLTQIDLAARLAVELDEPEYNQSNISRIETGQQDINTKQIYALARILQVHPADLFELSDISHVDPKWRRYLRAYAKLSETEIDALLTLARA